MSCWGGDLLKELLKQLLPQDLQNFILHHPDILTAIAASASAYKDTRSEEAHPVNIYLNSLGFVIEVLSDNLVLLKRTTAEGVKQAWFSVTGTDSISDAITNIGIGVHMHARDYHNFITSVWSDHVAPKLYSENSYCASTFNYISELPLNLYHMVNIAFFTASMYGFSKTERIQNLYDTYFGMLCSAGFMMSAAIYWNMTPHALYALRYKPHTNRLLARIRRRRKELEAEGYTDFFVTGHSAGGHGAQILGLLTGMRSFSFNAPGGALRHALWIYKSLEDTDGIKEPTEDEYKENVLAVTTYKDPVSALQHEQDPIQPTQIALNGIDGFIVLHKILTLFMQAQTLHVFLKTLAQQALVLDNGAPPELPKAQ